METIACLLSTREALYKAYMPFIQNGGLFIRSDRNMLLGTEVLLSLALPDDSEDYQQNARLVWITPAGAQGNKPAGLGMQFIGKNVSSLSDRIETILADMLLSTQLTDTL